MSLCKVEITSRDIPSAWFEVLQAVQLYGRVYTIDRGSYEGQKRKQLDHLTLHITHPNTKPMLPEIPSHLSIPPPATQQQFEDYLSYLMTSELKPNETYSYGYRMFGTYILYINQSYYPLVPIDYLIDMLILNTYTNQATLSISMPCDIEMNDPPCMRSVSFRTIEDVLHMFVHFRSWDLFGGLPLNLAGLTTLFEYVSESTEIPMGELVATTEGGHVYDYVFEYVNQIVGTKDGLVGLLKYCKDI